MPVGLKTFAKRVEDLLTEYKAAGRGKVIIEKFNPEPDSDAEDSAQLDGVEGQLTNTGEKFYLGLVGVLPRPEGGDPGAHARPRAAARVRHHARRSRRWAQAKKPVVGRDERAAGDGAPLNPITKQQPTEAVGADPGAEEASST